MRCAAILCAMRFLSFAAAVVLSLTVSACHSVAVDDSEVSPPSTFGLTAESFVPKVRDAHAKQSSVFSVLAVSERDRTLAMEGPIHWGESPTDVRAEIESSNTDTNSDVRMIVLGDDFYLHGSAGMPTDTNLKFDLTDSESSMAKQGEFIRKQLSPMGLFDELAQAKPEVVADGTGPRIDGVKTTMWILRVDSKALPSLKNAIRMGDSLELTMWLGEDMLVRKLKTKVEGGTLIQSWSDWGSAADVEAPRTEDVVAWD